MWRTVFMSCVLGCTDKTEPPDKEEEETPSPPDDTGVPPEDADGDGYSAELDCDDTDAEVFPGAPDLCGDDRVTDCTRTSEDGLVTVDGTTTFSDLQWALDAASSGSEIVVCPGAWGGPFQAALPVHLRAQNGPEATVLDGYGAGTVLTLPGGSSVMGFTILGGDSPSGGGIRTTSPGTFTVTDCMIWQNRADEGGGVSLAEGTEATISGTWIEDNQASYAGALLAYDSVVDLTGSWVVGNHAPVIAGISLIDSTLIGGTLSGNVATDVIGALSLSDSHAVDVIIEGNDAPVHAGVGCGGQSSMTGGRIASNTAVEGAAGGCSGFESDGIVLEGVEIVDNVAALGGALQTRGESFVEVHQCTILRNVAELGGGAAVGVRLTSVDSDWGSGIDDNTPSDVLIMSNGLELTGYEAGASFVCDSEGCIPAP